MHRDLVVLVQKYRDVTMKYGPFRFGVSAKEIQDAAEDLVWTLTEQEDGEFGKTVLSSGRRDEETVLDYAIGTHPFDSASAPIVVAEVVWFLCEKCGAGEISDPDECSECRGNGTVFIDVEEVAKDTDVELSESSIWARRQAD
jgi:predicted RNA-binding Zn-ribbon protein involved in translation (DUF1610 family)